MQSLALLLPQAANAVPPLLVVTITAVPNCHAEIAGKPVSDEEVGKAAQAADMQNRKVLIQANKDTPYRCLGSLIYRLQVAGAKNITFVAEPPEVE